MFSTGTPAHVKRTGIHRIGGLKLCVNAAPLAKPQFHLTSENYGPSEHTFRLKYRKKSKFYSYGYFLANLMAFFCFLFKSKSIILHSSSQRYYCYLVSNKLKLRSLICRWSYNKLVVTALRYWIMYGQ